MSIDTKGIELERRAHKLAWHMGYFARRRIKIFTTSDQIVTDIDVIGIKFDEMLSPQIAIFETKTGEGGFSSLLKLKGLLQYYQAHNAYVIRDSVTPDVIEFAEQIGINAMHTSRLDEIESELELNKNPQRLGFHSDYDAIVEIHVKVLSQNKLREYLLLKDMVWINANPVHTAGIIKEKIFEISIICNDITDPKLKSALSYIQLELLCQCGRLMLEAAGSLYTLPEHQRKSIFSIKLLTGKLTNKEKEVWLNTIYDFMTNFTTKILKEKFSLKREDFDFSPTYGSDMYEILTRLIHKPNSARHIPRLLDIYLVNSILNMGEPLKDAQKILQLDADTYDLSLKFCRDIASFVFNKNVPELLSKLMK